MVGLASLYRGEDLWTSGIASASGSNLPAVFGHEAESRELALRNRMGGDFYDRSPFHRARMQRAGIGKGQVRHAGDLSRLPPMGLDDIADFSELLLEPHSGNDIHEIQKYWPVHWICEGELPLGYSHEDLRLLGDLGAESLRAAGLREPDVIANLLHPGPSREYWQFALGAFTAGISSVAVSPSTPVPLLNGLAPTVLLGYPGDLHDLLSAADFARVVDRVHTVILVGSDFDGAESQALVERFGTASVVRAWAPPGVLALWSQCRGGEGFHLWPQAEFVELVDRLTGCQVPAGRPGEVLWTGTGWHATAMVRLATSFAARRTSGPCRNCGRRSERLVPTSDFPGFSLVLDENQHVTAWFAELQSTGLGEELVIWAALDEPTSSLVVLEEIASAVGSARVLIVGEDEVSRRTADAKGERFSDRRALVQNL